MLIIESCTRYLQSSVVHKLVEALFAETSPFIDVLPKVFHTLKLSGKWRITREQSGLALEIGDLYDNSLITRIIVVLGNSVKSIITTHDITGPPEPLMELLREHCQLVVDLSIEQAVERLMYQKLNYNLISHYAPSITKFTFKSCWRINDRPDLQRKDADKVCNLLAKAPTLSLIKLKYTVPFMKYVPAIIKRCGGTLREVDFHSEHEFTDNKFIEIARVLRSKCRHLVSIGIPPLLHPRFLTIAADLYASYKEKLQMANVPIYMNDSDCERFLSVCPNTKCTTLAVVPFTSRLLTIDRQLHTLQLLGINNGAWQCVAESLNVCTEITTMEVSTMGGQPLSEENLGFVFQAKLLNLKNLMLRFAWPGNIPLEIIGKSTGALNELYIEVSNLDSDGKMFDHLIICNPNLKVVVIKEKRYVGPERSSHECEYLTKKLMESFRACKKLEAFYVVMVGPSPQNLDVLRRMCESLFRQKILIALQYKF